MTGKIHIIVVRQEFDISVSHLYKWALRVVERCVLILALPLIKLFAWGEGRVEDMGYERRRAEACVD